MEIHVVTTDGRCGQERKIVFYDMKTALQFIYHNCNRKNDKVVIRVGT